MCPPQLKPQTHRNVAICFADIPSKRGQEGESPSTNTGQARHDTSDVQMRHGVSR